MANDNISSCYLQDKSSRERSHDKFDRERGGGGGGSSRGDDRQYNISKSTRSSRMNYWTHVNARFPVLWSAFDLRIKTNTINNKTKNPYNFIYYFTVRKKQILRKFYNFFSIYFKN